LRSTVPSGLWHGFAKRSAIEVRLPCLLKCGPGARSREDDAIMPAVRASYGARRIWRDVLEAGFSCGLHKIERLMRAQALRARPRRRTLPKDDGERSASAPC
jgi:putative transposase